MYRTILIGVDGSDGADHAVPFGVAAAKRDGARVVLAHVVEHVVAKGGGMINADEDELISRIEQLARDLEAAGVGATVRTTSVVLGGPAPALVQIAEEEGADLIVVGSVGHSVLAGMFMGSVAQRLSYLAKVPVLVIPMEAKAPADAADGELAEVAK